MNRSTLVTILALLAASLPAQAQTSEAAPDTAAFSAPEKLAQMADELLPSVVRVEYTLKYDENGESPGTNWSLMGTSGDWEEHIDQERPLEQAGFLLDSHRVLTVDLQIHPRFITRIAVRIGDQVVDATPEAYARSEGAVILRLAEPARQGRPWSFDNQARGPYLAASYDQQDGTWGMSIRSLSNTVFVAPSLRRVSSSSGPFGRRGSVSVILNRQGVAAGMTVSGELSVDGSWKGSPNDWELVSADQLSESAKQLEQQTVKNLLRVSLEFRSPRSSAGSGFASRYNSWGEDDGETMTEWNGLGMLVDDHTVVVLSNLTPKVTARLKSITVHGADDTMASFAGTLENYGCFLATLEKPRPGALRFATTDVIKQRNKLLLRAEVGVVGETRTAYYNRQRIGSYSVGWRRQLYPNVGGNMDYFDYGSGARQTLEFLFTTDGDMVAFPVTRRTKVSDDEPWESEQAKMLPVGYFARILQDRPAHIDTENKPLSEAEESRLAWLGVEMQGMDEDLARVNDVVDQTNGGQTGALVTFVYADSPASRAGIELGDILLRLHVEGQPKPLEVRMSGGNFGMSFDNMWAMMDDMPQEYLDRLPTPWGSAENTLTRALTDIGFGTPFTAEVFRNGKTFTEKFEVTQGPPHYNSAKRFKSEAAGVTIRDLTYEVRRYFQVTPDKPGVIISKIEKGSRAAVAGLKPYEFILSINDQPMHSVDEVDAAFKPGGEFRLNVKRMTVGRIVKIRLEPAESNGDDESQD